MIRVAGFPSEITPIWKTATLLFTYNLYRLFRSGLMISDLYVEWVLIHVDNMLDTPFLDWFILFHGIPKYDTLVAIWAASYTPEIKMYSLVLVPLWM